MNAEQVAGVVKMLGHAFPSWRPTEETCAVWSLVLSDQDDGRIKAAALRWIREANKFPPAVGELIALVKPAIAKSGAEAWEELIAEIRREGWAGKPKFRDAKIARGVEYLGGWVAICSQETCDVPSNRARFSAFYESLSARERDNEAREDVTQLLEQSAPLVRMLGLESGSERKP